MCTDCVTLFDGGWEAGTDYGTAFLGVLGTPLEREGFDTVLVRIGYMQWGAVISVVLCARK